MNASSVFGNLSCRAACAAGFVLLSAALSAGTAAAAGFDDFVVTDSQEPAVLDADEGSVVNSVVVESAEVADDSEEVGGGVYPGESVGPDAGCSCGGRGCHECLDSAGWINNKLCDVTPRFVGQVDALFLWQGAIGSRPLFYDSIDDKTVLDANQAQTPVSVGSRYAILANLDCTYAFEGNYFNVYGFQGEQSTPYSDSLYQMNNLGGLDYRKIDWAQVKTSGQIQSAEFNWRRRTCSPVTWLAGFRWVEWNQDMRILDVYPGFDSYQNDKIFTQTGNDLYGGQVGADVMLWNARREVTINGVGKAGVYYNRAFSRTRESTEIPPASFATKADQTAFFGEVGANANVKLTSWLSWRLGYSVFWLSGVAVPASQLSLVGQGPPNERPTINTNGSVLLHGATTGLEARW